MHVNKTKKIAILGVFAALSTVFTVLGTVISVNTVFFTALAAYLLGIIVVRFGIKEGILFYFVCAALDFFVNPNKMHVILYLALAAYILLSEGIFLLMQKKNLKEWAHCVIRLVIFLLIYVPMIFFFPKLLFGDAMQKMATFYPLLIPAGVIGWLVYDVAYRVFKRIFYERFHTII